MNLAFESVRILFVESMKYKVHKRKLDTREKFLARILDAAVRTKQGEDQLRRTTRDLHIRAAKCVEVDDGIFEHLL